LTVWPVRRCSSRIGVQRGIAHRQARLHEIAEFQQAHAEPVGAGIGAVDEPAHHHVVQDAVGGRRMQLGTECELFQADRVAMRSKGVQQAHHALDHLD